MAKLRLSIALCTYNGAKYLQEQLDSIASQSRLPDELIICDDGSQDNTIAVIKNFAEGSSFPVRLYINETHLGAIKNFEKAIRICDGDVIALSDQDDVWYPQKLEKIERAFLSSPDAGAVFSDADVASERLEPAGFTLWQSIRFTEKERKLVRSGKALEVLLRYNIITGMTLAFRSSYKKYVLPIPPCCMHDMWIALVIAMLGNIAMICEPLAKYRQHPYQQIGAKKNSLLSSYFQDANSLSCQGTSPVEWKGSKLVPPGYEIKIYGSAYERVKAELSIDPGKLYKLQSKIKHLQVRAAILKKNKLARLPIVLEEVFTMQYDHYSNGLIYVFHDLLA
jgi:glycosyltransferase involved in cell wall biosynthesis